MDFLQSKCLFIFHLSTKKAKQGKNAKRENVNGNVGTKKTILTTIVVKVCFSPNKTKVNHANAKVETSINQRV